MRTGSCAIKLNLSRYLIVKCFFIAIWMFALLLEENMIASRNFEYNIL